MKNFNAETTPDDIMHDPKEFGFPTFQEFSKNPQKFRNPEVLGIADGGSKMLNMVQKHKYKFGKYTTDKIEEIDRIIKDEGYTQDDLTMIPQILPDVGGKCIILIEFGIKQGKIIRCL